MLSYRWGMRGEERVHGDAPHTADGAGETDGVEVAERMESGEEMEFGREPVVFDE